MSGGEETSCAQSGNILCEHNCTDIAELAGFVCSCHHGFKMIKLPTLSDEDSNSTLILANASSRLENEQTSRRHSCEDIDECASITLNHCPHECVNLKGSFQCRCSNEYVDPHGDGSICEAVDSSSSVIIIAYGTEIRQVVLKRELFIFKI